MIGFFPKPYNDELAYSVFARYFSRSGYICYSSCAQDLYKNPKNKPSIEFINLLTKDAINQIGGIEDFVDKHTMVNFYVAFLSNERKEFAYKMAYEMNIKALMNALPIPKNQLTRYLKYCPICVKNDREELNETYWHRAHQLYGVNACYKHGCKLIDSNIPITSCASPSLINAEQAIHNLQDKISQALPVETELANYLFEILKFNHSAKVDIATYLKSALYNTPYISPRGARRYIESLSRDFKEYYKDIGVFGCGEPWQLEKLLNGNRSNPFEICLLGSFLNIQARELVSRPKPCLVHSIEDFDNSIRYLKSQGYNYHQIANQVGISYDYCKLVSYGKKENKKKKTISHNGGKKLDWQEKDRETLPKIIALINALNNSVDRPTKISIGLVERLIGLKECQLKKMPLCLEFVKAHMVPQEEHWGRVIAWAINILDLEDRTINITRIMEKTNIRKENVLLALNYAIKYLNNDNHINYLNSLTK